MKHKLILSMLLGSLVITGGSALTYAQAYSNQGYSLTSADSADTPLTAFATSVTYECNGATLTFSTS